MKTYTQISVFYIIGAMLSQAQGKFIITFNLFTGCAIKIGTQSFDLTRSCDRYPSNFKITSICYYTELPFEVYNSFLGQLA